MKGSQIWGSGGGVFFIAGKSGSEIGGGFFIARKSGVVFLIKFREICKIRKSGKTRFWGRKGKKMGWIKFGIGKKWEGKMYRRARNVSYPSYSYNIL